MNWNLVDDGTVKGLDEAIKTLKESKPYLFASSKPVGKTPKGGGNPDSGVTKEKFDNMSVAERNELYLNDRETFEKLVNQN